MSNALEFPDRDAINQPGFNPVLQQPNGVTYYWDPQSGSWVLMSAQSVNKDYVDARDELRYRRDGSDFIYGNVIIRPESDEVLDPTVIIDKQGKLIMSGENTIHFMSGTDELPKLTYGLVTDPTDVFEFDSNYLRHNLVNFYESGKTTTIIKVDNTGDDEVDLFDIKTLGGTTIAKHIIRLEEDKDCHFVVGGGVLDNGSFTVRGDNSIRIVTDSDTGFVVANTVATSNNPRDLPFKVEPETHKLTTSMAYSEDWLRVVPLFQLQLVMSIRHSMNTTWLPQRDM